MTVGATRSSAAVASPRRALPRASHPGRSVSSRSRPRALTEPDGCLTPSVRVQGEQIVVTRGQVNNGQPARNYEPDGSWLPAEWPDLDHVALCLLWRDGVLAPSRRARRLFHDDDTGFLPHAVCCLWDRRLGAVHALSGHADRPRVRVASWTNIALAVCSALNAPCQQRGEPHNPKVDVRLESPGRVQGIAPPRQARVATAIEVCVSEGRVGALARLKHGFESRWGHHHSYLLVTEVLPDEKRAVVMAMHSEGRRGAGRRRRQRRARSGKPNVGIAMGTGTDVAIESAGRLCAPGTSAGQPCATSGRNLFFAFVYNSPGVPIAAGSSVCC